MKLLKTLTIVVLVVLTACNQVDFDPIEIQPNVGVWTNTHTIAELIAEYASEEGVYPVRSNSGDANLFSLDTIPLHGDSIVISGTVISSDIDGNIYKSLIIQDPQTGDALKISIDVSGLSAFYPVGQSISIKCNGLAIGKYADLYQLGVVYYNNDSDARKQGYEPGRIPFPIFKSNVRINGMPNRNLIKVDTLTIQQIKQGGRSMHSRIVCIKDAKFNGYGEVNFNYKKLTSSELFYGSPKPTITGVPVAREIEDGTGKIYVSTSEFAKFASTSLPESNISGEITVIVGWYWDSAGTPQYPRTGSWQLTLRSIEDLGKGFESYHTQLKNNL